MDDIVLRCILAQVCQRGANMYFDALCHTLADLDVMLTAHILLNVCREVVASHADGVVAHNATQRDDSNLRASATNIDDHVALRSLYVNTNAQCGSHGFEYQIDVASVGMLCRVANRAELHLGAARRHTNHHAQRRREDTAARVDHLDKATDHLLASREVGDHAIAERADRADVGMLLLVHHLRLATDGNHLAAPSVQGHNGRLVHRDLIIADNDGVGRSQVHCYLLDK